MQKQTQASPANQVQDFCHHWDCMAMLVWLLSVPKGSHCHPRCHHLGQAFHCLYGETAGVTRLISPTLTVLSDRPPWLCLFFFGLRGTGTFSVPMPEKLLLLAGFGECYTSLRDCTVTLSNFATRPPLMSSLSARNSPTILRNLQRVSIMQRSQAPAVFTA